jgi:hypothetical protein
MKEALRNEFGEKLTDARRSLGAKIDMTEEDLIRKIDAINKVSTKTDEKVIKHVKENALIIDSHTEKLETNTISINCLKDDRVTREEYDQKVYELEELIRSMGSGQPVTIAAPVIRPKSGPRVSQADIDKWNKSARMIDE